MIIRTAQDKQQAIGQINSLDLEKRWQIEVKPYKKSRSLAQNSLMWLWFTEIKNFIEETRGETYSAQDLHDFYVDMLLPKKAIQFKNKIIHKQIGTSGLNVQQMSDFLFQIDRWCIEKMELKLTHPDDLYGEAMRG